MGSKEIQGRLWGQRVNDWAEIQEQKANAGYSFVLNSNSFEKNTMLLDVGCGAGYFCKLANDKGAKVVGIDASVELLSVAKMRSPEIRFLVGEIEELPFDDQSFDYVCGFNSFQYAENIKNAFTEAKRVLKDDGKLIAMIWGDKKNCETASCLRAIGSLLPAPPPGSPGPFALSENRLLERTLEDVGLFVEECVDIESVWDYPDIDTAIKGMLCTGPSAKAIEINGFDKVYETIFEAMKPYLQINEHVVYKNEFRLVISEKK